MLVNRFRFTAGDPSLILVPGEKKDLNYIEQMLIKVSARVKFSRNVVYIRRVWRKVSSVAFAVPNKTIQTPHCHLRVCFRHSFFTIVLITNCACAAQSHAPIPRSIVFCNCRCLEKALAQFLLETPFGKMNGWMDG